MTRKQMHIGLCLTGTWMNGQEPEPDALARHVANPLAQSIELAQAAERAKLDFIFKPDTLGVMPRKGRSRPMPGLDVTLVMAALARETSHVGLVTTASTTFNPPYVIARQMQTLHWLSNGRAGWNIVTSIEGAENFGSDPMPSPEERYRKAAECTQAVRTLWDSFPYEALTGEKPMAPAAHEGEFFSVAGPLNVPGHPAGSPPLFQAGASDAGRAFSASVADATFAAAPDMAAALDLRADLRARAEACGRSPDAIKVLPGLYFFLAPTREEAWAMHRRAHAHLTHEHRIESVRMILGADLSGHHLQTVITPDLLPEPDQPVRSRTHADLLRRYIERERPTLGQLLDRPEVVGSAHWVSVGTVEDVMADIISWHEAGAIDGVIALPGGSLDSCRLFLEELVPALAAKGLFRTDYAGKTLREHLAA
ncbi:NtaA/DmoA family FMN-dependent monooxygenase [Pannonibacter phragmitetus]|uniref:NtaA/DmoA family FMN-dependent monooxygenase n=1 Tax=Pannonibacter phragmitetus TaxID=121719 RepID=UPI000E66821D|nr:NtaA/DmoA family FMN-dependent monooxygenase [Pannonibacter phragmitetus]